jgi:3-hydroxyisobutyrate dehydrogenase-like beta-hydroxyacid dehydrogenase
VNIAFLGTGLMGSRMARRLLNAGFSVTVWNRSPVKTAALRDAGAKVAADPASASCSADIVVLMLADPPAVRETVFGPASVQSAFRQGLTIVDMSTVDPPFSVEMNRKCRDAGVHYFDAPVLGSLKPAEEGTLQVFAGTSEEEARVALPLLNTLGRAVYFLGRPGAGAAMKMAMNLYLGASMAALAEVLAFARNSGHSDGALLKVVRDAPIFDDSKKAKLSKIIESNDWALSFPLKWMFKDLELAVATAESADLQLPLARTSRALYGAALAEGYGDLDYSAIMKDYCRVCSRLPGDGARGPGGSSFAEDIILGVLERSRALTHLVLDQFPRQHTERRPRDGMPSCLQLTMRIAVIEKTLLSGLRDGNWSTESLSIPEIYHFETVVEFLRETRAETLAWFAQNRFRLARTVLPPSGREVTVAHLLLDLTDREASLRGQMMTCGALFGARFRNLPS